MRTLLKKELRLALHPTNLLFLALSALVLVPNYPYYVTFFYTGLGIFFLSLSGRENKDVSYTAALPVAKRDIVRARMLVCTGLEGAQLLLAAAFAAVSQTVVKGTNAVGMDANVAFFGLSLAMLGIFNFVFFGVYYKDVSKVGKAFGLSVAAVCVYMVLAETAVHAVPFFRDVLDTPDPGHLSAKLVVLAVGGAAYAALTLAALKISERNFEKQDL